MKSMHAAGKNLSEFCGGRIAAQDRGEARGEFILFAMQPPDLIDDFNLGLPMLVREDLNRVTLACHPFGVFRGRRLRRGSLEDLGEERIEPGLGQLIVSDLDRQPEQPALCFARRRIRDALAEAYGAVDQRVQKLLGAEDHERGESRRISDATSERTQRGEGVHAQFTRLGTVTRQVFTIANLSEMIDENVQQLKDRGLSFAFETLLNALRVPGDVVLDN